MATTLFFTGVNPKNLSGVSWKIWKIWRAGRTVHVCWGAAGVKKRVVGLAGAGRRRSWSHRSEAAAVADMRRRIDAKKNKGYELRPRRRPR